ncbi:MAG: nuclear transport factor 2 family protein [Candidatus Acidiferrales bacterium]
MSALTDSVQEMYTAFAESKAQSILPKLDENLEWELETSAGAASSGKGLSKIGKFFESIAEDYNKPELKMSRIVASTDKVAAFGHYTATVKATGRAVKTPVAHFFEFKDGKVTRFVGVLNAGALAEPRTETRATTPAQGKAPNSISEFYGEGTPLVALYVVSFALMVLGPYLRKLWPLAVAVIIFTAWDLCWVWCDPLDRTAKEILESSARARTYMSYFVAVYGAGLAYFLLRMGSTEQGQVFTIIRNAGVPMWLLIIPFALPTVAMLFIPIQVGLGKGRTLDDQTPTKAALTMFLAVGWMEKVATFSFLYAVIMIGISLVH